MHRRGQEGVIGVDSINHKFGLLEKKVAKAQKYDLGDMEVFQIYSWLVPSEKLAKVAEWTKELVDLIENDGDIQEQVAKAPVATKQTKGGQAMKDNASNGASASSSHFG